MQDLLRVRGRFIYWVFSGLVLGTAYVCSNPLISALIAWCFALLFVVGFRYFVQNRWYDMLGMGVGIYATAFHWLPGVLQTFSKMPIVFAYLAAGVLFLLLSFQFVVCAWLIQGLRRQRSFSWVPPLSTAWFSMELLFPKLIPWNLGDTQIALNMLAQSADLIGVSLISWLMIWVIESSVDLISAIGKKNVAASLRRIACLAVCGTVLFFYASHRIEVINKDIADARKIRIGVVQGNLDPIHDFLAHKRNVNIEKYQELSSKLLSEREVDLLIWPESSVGYDYYQGESTITRGGSRDPYPYLRTPLLFGGQTQVKTIQGQRLLYYNSAYLINRAKEVRGLYRKQVLFPFSEYVPFSGLFPFLEGINRKTYKLLAAEDEESLTLESEDTQLRRSVNIAVAICFEDMWSRVFLSQLRGKGAELLIVLSNDNWFLDSVAAYQHFMVARWRAIETRRYFVRAGNTGITTVVNPLGAEMERLPQNEEGALYRNDVGLLRSASPMVYWGLWPAKGIALFGLVIGLLPFLLRRLNY